MANEKLSAKDIKLQPIRSKVANDFIRKNHYSGKVVFNSQLHFGVFLKKTLHGVMSFGPPMDKSKVIGLVEGTSWNGMVELNRMAFDEALPRNSESRALSIAMRLLKQHCPHVEWVLSFADCVQCGDGIIYRAAGFWLTQIKKNTTIIQLADGTTGASMTYTSGKHILKSGGASIPEGSKKLPGFMIRYIIPLNKTVQERINFTILPYSELKRLGARMYKGKKYAVMV